MGKAVTFVCVVALGTLLLATAETGVEISSVDAGENTSLDSDVTSTSTSRGENFEQKTRAQKGDVLGKESNETVNEKESDRDDLDEISTTKTPRPTKQQKNNSKKPPGNISAGGKGSGGSKNPKAGQGRGKGGRKTTEGNSSTNTSSVITIGRLIADSSETDGIEPNKSVCVAPPEIEGAITPRLQGTEYEEGTTIAYSCNFGYVSRNSINHRSFCRYNETTGRVQWTIPEIKCIPRSCGDPGYLNNGRRIGNLFTFPNKVDYECEEGYKLNGLRARYCQAGGDWSGRLPTCELIYCSVPSDPVNGRVRYPSLEYGAELRYECDVGYMVKKHEPRTCSEDGTWSNEEPECIEARCEAPQSPEHGSVKLLGELKVGTLATYSCDHGRKLVGAITTKCLITGQWTFDAPQCSSTCRVPFIQNGEMVRIQTRHTTWNSYEETVKVNAGEDIESNEALFFRCKGRFSLVEDSQILRKDRIEVTCIDGTWSRNLQCSPISCDRNPPSTPNGKAIIHERGHGYTIWYDCKRPDMKKVKGNVTCHFGDWIGVPPKCLDSPCYTRDLNFIGLVKPLQEYLESRENFNIQCEYGYRRANSLTKITCNRGKWDITQNPCIHDTGRNRITSTIQPAWTPTPREVPYSVSVTPSSHQISDIERSRECFCTYDYESNSVKAKIGDKVLERGDRITQGKTVSLECPYSNPILTWQNSFRFFGKINMTCNTCEKWQSKDLPVCNPAQSSDAIIGSEEDFKTSPGGIVHVQRGQNRRFFCSSYSRQPQWNYNARGNVRSHDFQRTVGGNILFVSYLDIVEANDEHSELYECYTQNDFGHRTSSALQLRVDEVYCPFFAPSYGLNVSYSNGNKYSSWATFSCPANANLVGRINSLCQRNGTWTQAQPHCEFKDYTSCTRFPHSSELEVKYSQDVSVGSIATFSCSPSTRNLIGTSFSMCLKNGTWSSPLPSCEDPECSIGDLSTSVPQNVEPDMTGVTGEFVPSGSEMPLKCSDNTILQGNSKVLCGEDGKWKLGAKYECVPGCVLDVDSSSHLMIQPVKDSYRFGDFILLSCPPGEETSNNVERLMCLSGKWSDSLPFCRESEKTHQP